MTEAIQILLLILGTLTVATLLSIIAMCILYYNNKDNI
jgi:hypothetical protein